MGQKLPTSDLQYRNTHNEKAIFSLWSKYNATSTIIKLIRNKHPTTLYSTLMARIYQNRRHPNPIFKDLSKNRIGQKAISNWIEPPLQLVKTSWHERNLSDDSIRKMLKKTFYPQNYNWLLFVHITDIFFLYFSYFDKIFVNSEKITLL